MPDWTVIEGDCRTVLATLPEKSCHVCVTSPPYWGLRDYGLEPSVWGGDAECEHEWGGETFETRQPYGVDLVNASGASMGKHKREGGTVSHGTTCLKCPAWRGVLGLEPSVDAFVEHIVEVFRAVKRVLRDDGSLWCNVGDAYAHDGKCGGASPDGPRAPRAATADATEQVKRAKASGLSPKNLIGQPWRIAFALQADGWVLRSAMPWVKRSAMPESASDRPTSALEYVFLLTKSPKYFWDMEAVRMKAAPATYQRDRYSRILKDDGPQSVRHDHETQVDAGGRSFRNTDLFFESLKPPFGLITLGDELVGLDVTAEGLKEKHYASFPTKLLRPLILASTSERGACPECGCPWRRVVETSYQHHNYTNPRNPGGGVNTTPGASKSGAVLIRQNKTLGWEPGCECTQRQWSAFGHTYEDIVPIPIPCTVLDCFLGSGTSLVVAKQLGRRGIGIDASPTYCAMARRRIANPEPEPEMPDVEGQMRMFEPEVTNATH